MRTAVVERFGGPEVLRVVDAPTPEPSSGQVRVRLTSVGMNHADLMGRAGQYKLVTGDPPFTLGVEGGGVIDAVGNGVTDRRVGQRVILGLDAPRYSAPLPPGEGVPARRESRMRGRQTAEVADTQQSSQPVVPSPRSTALTAGQPSPKGRGGRASFNGTYATHLVCDARKTIPAPDVIPDDQLGAIWLAYLTAWGALIWQAQIKAGQFVAIPAASSSVGLAAAQVAKRAGAVTIGLTSSADKVDRLRTLPTAQFDHLVVTHQAGQMTPWHRELWSITARRGVDVFLDPVAAGAYLDAELKCLAKRGIIYVYGLLGAPGTVDVQPLIRKQGTIRGWVVSELAEAGPDVLRRGYEEILEGFVAGVFCQHIDRTFKLEEVRAAHEYMERGKHVGKLVLVP